MIERLIKDLCEFLTKYVWLQGENVIMSQYDGIGFIKCEINQIYEETYEFMKTLDYLVVIPADHGLYLPNKIMFMEKKHAVEQFIKATKEKISSLEERNS